MLSDESKYRSRDARCNDFGCGNAPASQRSFRGDALQCISTGRALTTPDVHQVFDRAASDTYDRLPGWADH